VSNATSPGARVLLTGSTGFVGKVVLEELLRRREELGIERIYLPIRQRKNKSPGERFIQDVASSPCFSRLEAGWISYCEPVPSDVTQDGLGLSVVDAARLRVELSHILHCAASVEFTLPLEQATGINITGALRVLAFAQTCPRLERLVHVSTAYVTPHPGKAVPIEEKLVDLPINAEEVYAAIVDGRADEKSLLAQTRHANTYTFTKCVAEVLLAERHGTTPLTLLRPSVVSACRRYPFPGWIDSRAAYAGVVSLFGAGYLRVIRVDPDARPDLVPCDDVADRILSCAFDPVLQKPLVIRHAVIGLSNSGSIAKLAYTHERYFQAHPHEKEARWAYLGTSGTSFRFREWVHHHLPVGAAQLAVRLAGRQTAAKRIDRLRYLLGYSNQAFYYFGRHTFDFRSAFPPLEGFDLDSYLETMSRGISEHLLKRNPREAPLRMHGTDLRWAVRQPDANLTMRAFAYVLRKVLRAARVEITFNEAEIKSALRHVREGDLIVLAPTHRSYMDFLVTSLLCFAHPGLGLKIPRVAATDDFSRIPLVGPLLQRAGAFYIQRGRGRADPALTRQITALVEAGHSVEFYVEGTRSRSRRFLAPKRGILRALQQSGRPAVILPLSISYDRVAEEDGFLRELKGEGKHKGGLIPLAKWTAKLLRGAVNLGRVHIRSGDPLRLDSDADVKALSRNIVSELQRHSAVTTFHLKAFCRRHSRLGIDPATLVAAIVRRGGVVIESKLDGDGEIPALIERTFTAQWMHFFYADARLRAPDNPAVASHISRNGFWFPETPDFDDPVTDGLVNALFEPVCRDYQAVAQAVETIPADSQFTAHDLLRRLPGSFFPDVEGALGDLAERGVLGCEGETYRWSNGPRDLTEYKNACAWNGAVVTVT
jgi:fatty acyl-CoA reductase